MAKKTSGAVTFRALASPKQSFSVGAETYRFSDGFFKTDNEVVIAFLRGNPYAEEIQENSNEGQPN